MSYAQAAKGLQTPKTDASLSIRAPEFVPNLVAGSNSAPKRSRAPAENLAMRPQNTAAVASKAKKRKPKLANMTIGDLIAKPERAGEKKKKKRQGSLPSVSKRKAAQSSQPALGEDHFPSLTKPSNLSAVLAPPKAKSNATPAPAPVALKEAYEAQSSPTVLEPATLKAPPADNKNHFVLTASSSSVNTKPRKKKLSTLKKRVLEERLAQWQALHPSSSDANNLSDTVILRHYCTAEELQDEDEYKEIVDNLHDLALAVRADLRNYHLLGEACFCAFTSSKEAESVASCWNGMVIQGATLECAVLPGVPPNDKAAWKTWCVLQASGANIAGSSLETGSQGISAVVMLENALTPDDLADEDCLQEALTDLKALASKYGSVEALSVEENRIRITYNGDLAVIRDAATAMSRVVLAGQQLRATVQVPHQQEGTTTIALRNILTEDDLEDEDGLQECLEDITELVGRFGSVDKAVVSEQEKRTILVHYESLNKSVEDTLKDLHAIMLGGTAIHPALVQVDGGATTVLLDPSAPTMSQAGQVPLMSGDKIIPERFAACKRVPKVANVGQPRGYARLVPDERVLALLKTMLAELMRLQKRALEDKNYKAKRRLVMGLREVHRGLRANKMKMVVMANNLDDYGVLDEKIQEILDVSREREVPVFFEFTKRSLGKAIGKNLKMAVVGVQNVDGANQEYKKLVARAPIL